MISKEYILGKLEEILEDPDIKTRDKLSAIKMCGEYLKMFEQSRKVQIDIRGLIAQMSDVELRSLNHVVPKHISRSSTAEARASIPSPTAEDEGVVDSYSEPDPLPIDCAVRSGIQLPEG